MITEAWAHLSVCMCVFVCVDSTLFTLTHMFPLPRTPPFPPSIPTPPPLSSLAARPVMGPLQLGQSVLAH